MSGHFAMNRIKTIMKSSADVDVVSKESIFVVTRAAELFVKLLSKEAYTESNKAKKLDYKNIANVVNGNRRYDFLCEMIPHKITVDEYYKIMKETCGEAATENDNESSNEGNNGTEDEEEDEEETTNSKEDDDCIIVD